MALKEKEQKKIKKEEKREKTAEKPLKLAKKVIPTPNDFIAEFRVGCEIEVNGLPFKVKEIRGVELILARTDIK